MQYSGVLNMPDPEKMGPPTSDKIALCQLLHEGESWPIETCAEGT